MDKEEILEKSRKQNKNNDPFEQQVIAEASKKAYLIGILIACTFYAIETFCNHTQNYAVMAVLTSMEGVMFIYKYVKMRKSEELVLALVFTLGATIFITLQILKLAGITK